MKYYVYSFHRSGSTFLTQVLQDICRHKGLKFVFDNDKVQQKTLRGDYCFYTRDTTKSPPKMAKAIFNLRDPRDVATSMFYSYCFYHGGKIHPSKGIRKQMAQKGVDYFVEKVLFDKKGIKYYGTGTDVNIKDKYDNYIKVLETKEECTLLSYEEMVSSFDSWLEKLLIAFDIDNEKFKNALYRKYKDSFKVGVENKRSHKRRITPKDYLDKLQPETIEKITNGLSEVLDVLGYEH